MREKCLSVAVRRSLFNHNAQRGQVRHRSLQDIGESGACDIKELSGGQTNRYVRFYHDERQISYVVGRKIAPVAVVYGERQGLALISQIIARVRV